MKLNTRIRRAAMAGFSLAELMVVILIIGLLATVVVPKVMDNLGTAKWGKVKADLQALGTTLGTFAMKNGGDYPDSLDRLVEEDGNGKRYLAQTVVPKDPWGNVYGYNPPDGNSDFELICYGKDGVPGGEGDNRDLSYQDVIDGTE